MKYALWLLLAAALPLGAKTVSLGDRVGEVVNAEYSAAPQEITGRSSSKIPAPLPKERFIVITVKMPAGRSMSLVDYNLRVNGATVPCMAAARDTQMWLAAPDPILVTGNSVARLLFVVDGSKVRPADGKLTATLQPALRGRRAATFTIRDIGDRKFTEPGQIPEAGLLP